MSTTRVQPPWITPRAGERHQGAFAFDGEKIFFPDLEEDRELGVLWQPSTGRCQAPRCGQLVAGHDADHEVDLGEVWWKEMHTGRQKRAMLDRLCQVCGQRLEGASIPWLLPGIETRSARGGRPFVTTTPPVCDRCVTHATQSCPNLKMYAPLLLDVRDYRVWGVWGDTVVPGPPSRLTQGEISLGNDTLRPLTMARHVVVEIFNYRRARRQPTES